MPRGPEPGPLLRSMVPAPDAIEPLSMQRLAAAAEALPDDDEERQIALRIAYAVGDVSVLPSVVCASGAVRAGVEALRRGAAIITDVRMVLTGIDRPRVKQLGLSPRAAIDEPGVPAAARERGITRSAQGILSLADSLEDAIVVIGNAPTALLALLDLIDGGMRPALVLGFPVGYVAAAESKDELMLRAVPYITIRGQRGGTPMAVAAINTLLRLATEGMPAVTPAAPDARLHIVGIGDDGWDGLGARARALIEGARTIYGGARQLALLPESEARRVDIAAGYETHLEDLVTGTCGPGTVVLASGDPMLFGIGSALAARLGDEMRARVEVIPHVGSVQVALARLGVPSDGVVVLSALARPLRPVLAQAMASEGFVVLLDRAHTPAVVARTLLDAGMEDARAIVGERLESAAERIVTGRLSDLVEADFDPLSLLVVLREAEVVATYRRSAIPEGEFAHRAGLITKAEVRALAVAALQLRPDSVLWDIGAGSGSVGIEAALSLPRGAVYAVERDAEQLAFVEENRVRFRTPQVEAVHGAAPDALAMLPDPDAIFIGGGGASLPAILEVAMARLRPGGRLVGTLATIERVAPTLAALRAWSPELREVSIAHGVALAEGTRLQPANPVFLFAATRPPEPTS